MKEHGNRVQVDQATKEEIRGYLEKKIPTTRIIRKMQQRYPYSLVIKAIKDICLNSGTPFFERCQKKECGLEVEPGKKYCCREHAPYGYSYGQS